MRRVAAALRSVCSLTGRLGPSSATPWRHPSAHAEHAPDARASRTTTAAATATAALPLPPLRRHHRWAYRPSSSSSSSSSQSRSWPPPAPMAQRPGIPLPNGLASAAPGAAQADGRQLPTRLGSEFVHHKPLSQPPAYWPTSAMRTTPSEKRLEKRELRESERHYTEAQRIAQAMALSGLHGNAITHGWPVVWSSEWCHIYSPPASGIVDDAYLKYRNGIVGTRYSVRPECWDPTLGELLG